MLGKLSSLQVHHIFPKALLYQHGHDKRSVNAIANLTFLTQETNLLVSDRDPADYLIDEGRETEEAANRTGYRYFTDIDAFRAYVQHGILVMQEDDQ